MAHYAILDENNIVTSVIVGFDEEYQGTNWEKEYSKMFNQKCLRTSYNTLQGKHLNGGRPFRGNYAGIGYFYHRRLDAFIPPKPYDSWVLNPSVYDWEAPVPYPTDGDRYVWNEDLLEWEIDQEGGGQNV